MVFTIATSWSMHTPKSLNIIAVFHKRFGILRYNNICPCESSHFGGIIPFCFDKTISLSILMFVWVIYDKVHVTDY